MLLRFMVFGVIFTVAGMGSGSGWGGGGMGGSGTSCGGSSSIGSSVGSPRITTVSAWAKVGKIDRPVINKQPIRNSISVLFIITPRIKKPVCLLF